MSPPDRKQKQEASLGTLAARGAIWGVAVNAIAAPLNLAVTGYALAKLGAEMYGTFALIAVFGSYLRVGDFGLSAAFSRTVAERLVHSEIGRLERSLSSVTTLILISGLLLCSAAWLLRDPILFLLFRIPGIYADESRIAFGMMLTATLIALITPSFSSLLIGAQRTDLEKKTSGLVHMILAVGIAVVVYFRFDLIGLASAHLTANLLGLASYIVMAKRVLPQVRLRPFTGIDFSEAGHLLRFGGGFQLTQTTMQIMTQMDRLFIGHFLGVGMAGMYDVVVKALYTVHTALSQLLAPLYPAAARLNAQQRTVEIRGWIRRVSRLYTAMATPVYGLICTGAPAIVAAWIGRPEPRIAQTLAILSAVQAFNSSNAAGYHMLLGSGRLRPILTGTLLSAGTGLVLAWSGVVMVGYYGVVAAHATAILILFLWIAVSLQQAFQTSVWEQIRLVPIPLAIGAAEGVALSLLAPLIGYSRLGILALAVLLSVFGQVLLWMLPYLKAEDRHLFYQFLRWQPLRTMASRISPVG
jgi:O-antigen/teichoic acid export membrane protein